MGSTELLKRIFMRSEIAVTCAMHVPRAHLRIRTQQKREHALVTSQVKSHRQLSHPVHIVLAVSMLPLFLGSLLSDWAYTSTYQIQWINFASWLIVGALIFAGLTLLWAVIDALRADAPRGREKWVYAFLVAATTVVGFINAFVHAKEAGATMPAGLVLSVITLILAAASIWHGFAGPRTGEAK